MAQNKPQPGKEVEFNEFYTEVSKTDIPKHSRHCLQFLNNRLG